MATAEWASTLGTLGGPVLVGTVLGAFLSYYFGRRLLDDQSDRQAKFLARQRSIDAALRTDEALQRLSTSVATLARGETPQWGTIHNQWQDEVMGPAAHLRNDDLRSRVSSVGFAIFQAWQHKGESLGFVVNLAIADAQAGLQAVVAEEPIPPARFPDNQETMSLLWSGGRSAPDVEAWRQRVIDGVS